MQDVQRASVAAKGVITGAVAVVLAFIIAVTANSIALWADWVATLLDCMAIAIAWWGLNKAAAGKTDTFHFGFGRFESLASMGMAVLMVISFLCIFAAAIVRIINPVPIEGVGVLIGFVLHLIFGVINLRLTLQSYVLERREKTALITAQRRMFAIKTTANFVMFVSLGLSYFLIEYAWVRYVDPIAAMVIGGTILAGASKMFRFSVSDLLDCAIEEQAQQLIIRALTRHYDQYEQIHDIRTRQAGGRIYVEIFLEFAPESRSAEVMETVRSLQHEIRTALQCHEVMIIPV